MIAKPCRICMLADLGRDVPVGLYTLKGFVAHYQRVHPSIDGYETWRQDEGVSCARGEFQEAAV